MFRHRGWSCHMLIQYLMSRRTAKWLEINFPLKRFHCQTLIYSAARLDAWRNSARSFFPQKKYLRKNPRGSSSTDIAQKAMLSTAWHKTQLSLLHGICLNFGEVHDSTAANHVARSPAISLCNSLSVLTMVFNALQSLKLEFKMFYQVTFRRQDLFWPFLLQYSFCSPLQSLDENLCKTPDFYTGRRSRPWSFCNLHQLENMLIST